MAKNVTIAGASYSGVPSIEVPITGGGTATFRDCVGSTTITENGTVDVAGLASVVVDVASSGGGIPGIDLLYSDDAMSISYTSTSAGTATTISGIANLCKYPFVVVVIENTDTAAGSLKFIRSNAVIGNVSYASSGSNTSRYGLCQYYTQGGGFSNLNGTSYGLWGYTISTSNNLTIRGRCSSSYFTSLTGTYKIKVLGIKL